MPACQDPVRKLGDRPTHVPSRARAPQPRPVCAWNTPHRLQERLPPARSAPSRAHRLEPRAPQHERAGAPGGRAPGRVERRVAARGAILGDRRGHRAPRNRTHSPGSGRDAGERVAGRRRAARPGVSAEGAGRRRSAWQPGLQHEGRWGSPSTTSPPVRPAQARPAPVAGDGEIQEHRVRAASTTPYRGSASPPGAAGGKRTGVGSAARRRGRRARPPEGGDTICEPGKRWHGFPRGDHLAPRPRHRHPLQGASARTGSRSN